MSVGSESSSGQGTPEPVGQAEQAKRPRRASARTRLLLAFSILIGLGDGGLALWTRAHDAYEMQSIGEIKQLVHETDSELKREMRGIIDHEDRWMAAAEPRFAPIALRKKLAKGDEGPEEHHTLPGDCLCKKKSDGREEICRVAPECSAAAIRQCESIFHGFHCTELAL